MLGTVVDNIEKGGGEARVSGMFFKELVQEVIIMRSETWMMTLCMGRTIEEFNIR